MQFHNLYPNKYNVSKYIGVYNTVVKSTTKEYIKAKYTAIKNIVERDYCKIV